MRRLRRFFEYYKDLTTSYEVEQGLEKDPALRTHEDLLEVIGLLKACPDVARSQLVEKMFSNQPGRKPITVEDQERAINLAVRVLAMINCSGQRQTSTLLEHGMFQTPWRSNISLGQFISDAFPMTDHPTLNDQDVRSSTDVKPALAAKKLKKKLGLAFQPTDDIGSHLKLNHKKNVVEIYHHTSFLKEHLRLTKGQPTNMSVNESLKIGALPRQLALEVLDSVQKILFPLADDKSRALLQSLTSTAGFDPDVLRFESSSLRCPEEMDIAYHYLGTRIMALYEELQNPKPRGWIEKWLERRSGARYVMMATLIGVIIAICLGMASLAVGSYQAWLSYQQWQHSIEND